MCQYNQHAFTVRSQSPTVTISLNSALFVLNSAYVLIAR